MDGLSAAASCIAVGSLSIQLAENTKRLYDFWSSVQDAPKEIQAILRDLKILLSVLQNIQVEEQTHGPSTSSVINNALESCLEKVVALKSFISQFESGYASGSRTRRKWSSIKAAFQKDRVEKFRSSINETKLNLGLALQHINHVNLRQQRLTTITNTSGVQIHVQESRTVTTPVAAKSSGPSDHMKEVCSEVERMTAGMANPMLRSALQRTMVETIRNVVKSPEVQEAIAHEINTKAVTTATAQPQDKDTFISSKKVTECEGDAEDASKAKRLTRYKRHQVTGATSRYRPRLREVECSKSYTKHTSFFGILRIHTKTLQLYREEDPEDDVQEPDEATIRFETSFSLYPARWLLAIGFSHGLRFDILKTCQQGWKQSLSTFRAVPDDALIFELCGQEDIQVVGNLIQNGQASVWDTDSRGRTPLHYAAAYARPDMCKALLKWGADPNVRTSERFQATPMADVGIIGRDDYPLDDDRVIDTLRVILKHYDIESATADDDDGQDLRLLALKTIFKSAFSTAPISWLLQNVCTYILKNGYALDMLMSCAVQAPEPDLLKLLLKLDNGAMIGHLVTYAIIAVPYLRFSAFPEQTIKLLIQRGGTLQDEAHIFCDGWALVLTAYAMETSMSFFRWRTLLKEYNVDLPSYIEQQMEDGAYMRNLGWNKKTLTALFNYHFEPVNGDEHYERYEWICGLYEHKERWWCKNMEKIKRGQTPDEQPAEVVWEETLERFSDYGARLLDGGEIIIHESDILPFIGYLDSDADSGDNNDIGSDGDSSSDEGIGLITF
ncbi:MAG: hypothetical protein M1830_007522 [Pleopsidium flavum]|nr:MAG: hypothetical protein M1830_007522 [Pleopsidium flavum]